MIILYVFLGIVSLGILTYFGFLATYSIQSRLNMNALGSEAGLVTVEGFTFRDLNKNGRLDPYEDPRVPVHERVEDLLTQMTLEEKTGLMFITMTGMEKDGSLQERFTLFSPTLLSTMIVRRHMNSFNLLKGTTPLEMAKWNNTVQTIAERTRLGIPVSIASDPRHAFSDNPAASMLADHFSQWPEQLGLAAIGDEQLVMEFGDIARQEYLAVGIRIALHPMADLATEPRWGRINGTFGEDAQLSSKLVKSYILGFQGDRIDSNSVICMTKHFPGGGPQKDGEDPHFDYGKEQVYPGNKFEYHLRPFKAAFEAGTGQIMPYYGMPIGLPYREVAFSFNHEIITGLLRDNSGFNGVVCTDWGIITGMSVFGYTLLKPISWGVEDLTLEERIKMALDAGVDQFGGENIPGLLVKMVRKGLVPEERIDTSARRILHDKFRLGLFDNPFVDPNLAAQTVGKTAFKEAGEQAQRRSIVLLKNGEQHNLKILPLNAGLKLYVENISHEVASQFGELVDDCAQADFAILRLNSPYEPRKGLVAGFFHAGDLDFKGKEKERILRILETIPTVVSVYMDRPPVIPEINDASAALLVNFGANDQALLDVIFGRFSPSGKLPVELPSSMEAVRGQRSDVPSDSKDPLYPFGFGLTYGSHPSRRVV